MLALEDDNNPTRIVVEDKVVIIPQGCMMIWRGDYAHAGALYTQINHRLFFHVVGPDHKPSIIDDIYIV